MKEQVVVITGASSGIGAEMAIRCSKLGMIPILLARSSDKLQQVSALIEGRVDTYTLDVTSEIEVKKCFAQIKQKWGRIDVLINNAGYGVFKKLEECSSDEIRGMMEVNYFGMVYCTQAVLSIMREQGQGHVINVASLAGKIGTAKSAAYSATKHAVVGFTQALRQELRGTSIYVTTVNPGPIATPFFDLADPDGAYLQNLPSWFVLKPQKVADKVVELIGKNKLEVNLPAYTGWVTKLSALFPRAFDRYVSGMLNKK